MRKKLLVSVGIAIITTMALVLALVAACAKGVTPTTPGTATTTAPTATTPAQQVYKWRWADFAARGTEYFNGTMPFLQHLQEASGGRFQIEILGAGEVFEAAEVMDAMSKGLVEFGWSVGAYNTGKSLGLLWTSGAPPLALPDRDHTEVFYRYYGAFDILQDWYHKNLNIHMLGVSTIGIDNLITKFPVTKVADLKGHTMRSYGPIAEMLAGAGAAVSWFPMEEVYSALEKGVIDGAVVGSACSEYGYGLHEVAGNFLLTPVNNVECGDIGVNLDKWNSLPPDLQALLQIAWQDHCATGMQYFLYKDALAIKEFKKAGVKFTTMPNEEVAKLRAASMAVAEEYAKKDALYAQILDILKKYMSDIGLL